MLFIYLQYQLSCEPRHVSVGKEVSDFDVIC